MKTWFDSPLEKSVKLFVEKRTVHCADGMTRVEMDFLGFVHKNQLGVWTAYRYRANQEILGTSQELWSAQQLLHNALKANNTEPSQP